MRAMVGILPGMDFGARFSGMFSGPEDFLLNFVKNVVDYFVNFDTFVASLHGLRPGILHIRSLSFQV